MVICVWKFSSPTATSGEKRRLDCATVDFRRRNSRRWGCEARLQALGHKVLAQRELSSKHHIRTRPGVYSAVECVHDIHTYGTARHVRIHANERRSRGGSSGENRRMLCGFLGWQTLTQCAETRAEGGERPSLRESVCLRGNLATLAGRSARFRTASHAKRSPGTR